MPARRKGSGDDKVRGEKRDHGVIEEEDGDEADDNQLLNKSEKTGQVCFDPPYYSKWIYPKKYKRDDMGALSGWLGYFILGLVIAGFLWLTYVPSVPEYMEERLLLRSYTYSFGLTGLLSFSVVPFLTGYRVSSLDFLRWSTDLFFSSHIPDNDPWVEISYTQLDGVPAKIFRPRSAPSDAPAVVYIHGGGWCFLSAEGYSSTTYNMALKSNAVVVSIEYRLAPEHPYPVPFDDCVKATRHFLLNAKQYNVDPQRVAIAGDSAGGNLAAAVALKLSEEAKVKDQSHQVPRLRLQVLINPALQMYDFNLHSYTNFTSIGWLSRDLMIYFWLQYLGMPQLQSHAAQFAANNHTSCSLKNSKYAKYLDHGLLPQRLQVGNYRPVGADTCNETLADRLKATILDPYFSPLMADDLSGLPAAYFVIPFSDVLRDESLMYAERIRQAGVETVVDFYEGMAHGFSIMSPVEFLRYKRGYEVFDKLAKYMEKHL